MSKDKQALSDVRRKVAEVMKKEGDKLVFGWRGDAHQTRKEGDEWEDRAGKKWVVKNGITQTVTKLDDAKTPFWCPKCTKPLNHRLDLKFWRLRGHCMDCNVKFETELRRQGKWEEFERKTMLRNYIAQLKDSIAELQFVHETITKPEFINADDTNILMVEKWDVDIDKVKSDIMTDLEKLQAHLKETIEQHGTGEDDEQQVDAVTATDAEQTANVS